MARIRGRLPQRRAGREPAQPGQEARLCDKEWFDAGVGRKIVYTKTPPRPSIKAWTHWLMR
jgi:hypothetical protein